jgi:hypothetical protein
MDDTERRSHRLVAICLLGFMLFNYPVLALFNVPATVWGVPVLYLHLFVAWAAVIGLMALVMRRGR